MSTLVVGWQPLGWQPFLQQICKRKASNTLAQSDVTPRRSWRLRATQVEVEVHVHLSLGLATLGLATLPPATMQANSESA